MHTRTFFIFLYFSIFLFFSVLKEIEFLFIYVAWSKKKGWVTGPNQ